MNNYLNNELVSVDLNRIEIINQLTKEQKNAFTIGFLYHEAHMLNQERISRKLTKSELAIVYLVKESINNLGLKIDFLSEYK